MAWLNQLLAAWRAWRGGSVRVRPNRHTLLLLGLLAVMWYASAAQQNGSAFILVFVVAGLGLVSWLHARANLRALEIKAGVLPVVRDNEPLRVPLTLSVGAGRSPCGLEITAKEARSAVFVDEVQPGVPQRCELVLNASGTRGLHDSISIVARSLYPLGFFTAERVIEVSRSHLVLPRAAGTLPLPAPVADSAHQNESPSRPAMNRGDGEDFAGVREWQAGDSLRHVDWKAVARGRPLMVKLWSGAPSPVVWLDWQNVPLTGEARPRQLAKWIEEAEREGCRYGLRLPQQEIKPNAGPAQQRRCLEALALTLSQDDDSATQGASLPAAQRVPSSEATGTVPGRPLLLMGAALLLGMLGTLGLVPWAGPLAFVLGLLLRAFGPKAAPLWVKLLPVLTAVGGTLLQHGSLKGLEPGVALLLGMAGAKFIEARSPRDLQLLAVLGWFLCICVLALEQSLGYSLLAYGVFMLIATSLIRFRRGLRGFLSPMKASAVLLLQASPLILALFLLFPRDSFGLMRQLTNRVINQSGMSDRLDPGNIASLAKSDEKAFWAEIENLSALKADRRYWRCSVLTYCKGLSWERGGVQSEQSHAANSITSEVRQTITLAPHGGYWLPCLEKPVRLLDHTMEHRLSAVDDTMVSTLPVGSMRRYRVASVTVLQQHSLPTDHLRANLQVPDQIPERLQELADECRRDTDSATLVAALTWLRKQPFQYTLEPGMYPQNARGAEQFLFDRHQGFCEHYAASFALLMRLAGVPARVVTGYLGGESGHGGHLIVRQSDAHAWTEVWMEGEGWRLFDPVAALVPMRLNADLRTALESSSDQFFARARNTWLSRAMDSARLRWDQVNYLWYDRVVQFDEHQQFDLWQQLGLFRLSFKKMLLLAMLVFGLPLLLLWWWLHRPARARDPAVRLWERCCHRLVRAGAPKRESNEGPLDYARRASRALPHLAERIEQAARHYIAAHYADDGAALKALKNSKLEIRN